jgi:hypothetical protein
MLRDAITETNGLRNERGGAVRRLGVFAAHAVHLFHVDVSALYARTRLIGPEWWWSMQQERE